MPAKQREIRSRSLYWLIRMANIAARKRGHVPLRWYIWPPKKDAAVCECKHCGMRFGVLTRPYPIETAISGTALAYDCPNRKKGRRK